MIKDSWGWTGIVPADIVAMNSFGNLLIRDSAGRIWRLCPEDLYCRVIAEGESELASLLKDSEFAEDWEMRPLVRMAHEKLGPLQSGRRYCLKLPAPVGGTYSEDNLATLPLDELVGFAGYVAQQIKDLPDGAQIRFTFPNGHAA